MFRRYKIHVVFNENHFTEIWIDPHYEKNHLDSITDDLILSLLQSLETISRMPQDARDGFRYFEVDTEYDNKNYRMILVVPDHLSYLGVRNAYRRSK